MDDWGARGGLNVKCNPSTPPSFLPSFFFLLFFGRSSDWLRREEFRVEGGDGGGAVVVYPQRQDPEATAPACVLCLEEYIILFICIYISGSCCSCSLLPLSLTIHRYESAKSNKGNEESEDSIWAVAADLQMLLLKDTVNVRGNFKD